MTATSMRTIVTIPLRYSITTESLPLKPLADPSAGGLIRGDAEGMDCPVQKLADGVAGGVLQARWTCHPRRVSTLTNHNSRSFLPSHARVAQHDMPCPASELLRAFGDFAAGSCHGQRDVSSVVRHLGAKGWCGWRACCAWCGWETLFEPSEQRALESRLLLNASPRALYAPGQQGEREAIGQVVPILSILSASNGCRAQSAHSAVPNV